MEAPTTFNYDLLPKIDKKKRFPLNLFTSQGMHNLFEFHALVITQMLKNFFLGASFNTDKRFTTPGTPEYAENLRYMQEFGFILLNKVLPELRYRSYSAREVQALMDAYETWNIYLSPKYQDVMRVPETDVMAIKNVLRARRVELLVDLLHNAFRKYGVADLACNRAIELIPLADAQNKETVFRAIMFLVRKNKPSEYSLSKLFDALAAHINLNLVDMDNLYDPHDERLSRHIVKEVISALNRAGHRASVDALKRTNAHLLGLRDRVTVRNPKAMLQ